MDDKIFDKTSAEEWIKIIEGPGASIRDQDLYPFLRQWLDQASPKNILDIGCGQGVCSIHLGKTPVQYVGIDPSDHLVARANELYSNSARKFVNGNAYHIPFDDKYFDAAFSINVWHLLGDTSAASRELSRILKNDGKFLIMTADPAQGQSWMDNYEDKKTDGEKFIGTNYTSEGTSSDTLYLRSEAELRESLSAQGLAVSMTKTIRSLIAIYGCKI